MKKLRSVAQHAFKAKQRLATATATARSLEALTTSAEEWRWANNNENLGELRAALQKVTDNLSNRDKEVLATDARDLRSRYGAGHLMTAMTQFLATEKHVEHLWKVGERIENMHRATAALVNR